MMQARKRVIEAWLDASGGRKGGAGLKIFRACLLCLSFVYGALSFIHRKSARPAKLPCPVISVGNLVCGGTGKTPAAEYIAEFLIARGHKPAVLSRGYMGRASSCPAVVSDGEKLLPGADGCGDEPLMLAANLRGAVIISGRNRRAAGRCALETLGATCAVLDDGFQHYNLSRDLDIVVIDGTNPFGNGCLFPRGELREKPESLKRADLIILTHVDFCGDTAGLKMELNRISGGLPVVESVHAVEGFDCLDTGGFLPSGGLAGRRALLFSAIGRHGIFEETARRHGIEIAESLSFPDHHDFSGGDMEEIFAKAAVSGAECLVTTQKDSARLKHRGEPRELRIYAMKVRFRPVKGEEQLKRMLTDCAAGAGG